MRFAAEISSGCRAMVRRDHSSAVALEHLRHLTAFFRAIAAGATAFGHVFIVGHALARLGAALAASSTALKHCAGEWALPRTKYRARFAAFGAVDAVLSAFGMLLFSFG